MPEDKVQLGVVIWIVFLMLLGGVFFAGWTYHRGYVVGSCEEMCRPAQFDSDQTVNGGCLCIGSDKVLRFKKTP
jgi:hypothetical protein